MSGVDFTPEEIARLKGTQQPKELIVVTSLADVEPRKMPFLWHPYLPLGRLVIVAGAPGHGKSQFSALIAAMASRGALPGDIDEASKVLMLCAEDDIAATVVPRLLAVNADVRQIDTINVRTEYPSGLTVTGMLQIPGDVETMHEWVRSNPTARLIVLDPVVSFFDRGHNALYNQDVRAALGPLAAIAETYGVTVVVILHLNKSESKDFANRISESHGFQALARSVLALGPDPSDAQGERGSTKVIALTKANLIKPGNHSIRCEVRSTTLTPHTHGVPEPIETSQLVLLGKCEISADDLLLSSADRTARVEAKDWLAEFVGEDEWRRTSDVKKAAESDGISWRSVQRVRETEGYQRHKGAGAKHGGWWIGGPRAHARDVPNVGSLGGVGDLESQDPDRNVGGVGDLGHPNNATPPRQPGFGTSRAREGSWPANGKPSEDELADYRKHRDRMLGERDDEDDDQ